LGSILISNIGNNDIHVKESFILPSHRILEKGPIDYKLAREIGREIFEHVKDLMKNKQHTVANEILQDKLEYPILDKVLRALQGYDIESIYLIASDQAGEKNFQDTVYYAQIIEKHINSMKGKKDCESIGNCKVRIRTTDKNPADMDDMNEFYKQTLKGIYSNHDNAEKYYLCVTGGTQAMNSMLLINGVDMFKHRLEVLYVLPHKKNPLFLQVGQEMLKKLMKERLIASVNNMDFNAAINLLEDNKNIFYDSPHFKKVYHSLIYAHARLSFDFELAGEEIKKCVTFSTGNEREFFCQLQEETEFEDELKDLKFFLELKDNAKYHALRGEYIDFLGRLFRMQEAGYFILAEEVGMKTTNDKRYLKESWLLENKELKRYLESYKTPKGEQLNWRRELNRIILEAVVGFFAKNDEKLQMVLNDFRDIDQLAELRNKTLVAHGYQGVSKRIVEREFGAKLEDILHMLDRIADGVCNYKNVVFEKSIFYEHFVPNLLNIVEQL
jgi:hypothetical protein